MVMKHKQLGATLITALVMLVVLTLLVISAIRSSNTNLRIAGNMQVSEEAAAAAQQTIETVISTNFTAGPIVAASMVNGYQVSVPTPTCQGSTALLNNALNMNDPNDLPCFSSSSASNTGIFFVSGVPTSATLSWCYAQRWDVQASAVDATAGTGANVTMHQGVSMRVPAGTTC